MIVKTRRTPEFRQASAFRPASALRVLSMVCLAILCAAGGSLSLLGILALAGLALWGRVFCSERRAKPAILAMRLT
jgi:hypothetical protein